MTAEERILWQALRRNQLDGLHFRRQQVIDGFIVDFYRHRAGLVVEIDGDLHDTTGQASYDAERDEVLAARGLRILRVSAVDVRTRITAVLDQIAVESHDEVSV